MKWNILIGSLVLGLGLSTQSFGADLLDRMLGANYNGCCPKASCCDAKCVDPCCGVDPGCGCEVDPCCDPCCQPAKCKKACRRPLLDLLRCGNGLVRGKNCCEPTCGVDPCCEDPCCEPTCGVDPCCEDPCCEPTCGVDPCCARNVCKPRSRVSLLDRIFCRRACVQKSCCDPCCEPVCGFDPGCGCEPTKAAPVKEPKEAAPEEETETAVGPALIVDPSAFLPTKRRIVQTNLIR